MFILKRYQKFYKSNGLLKSMMKIISTPLRLIKKRNYNKNKKNIFSHNLSKKKFELIYKSNFWSSKESVSGLGSEYKNTINLRNEMVKLIKDYKIDGIISDNRYGLYSKEIPSVFRVVYSFSAALLSG